MQDPTSGTEASKNAFVVAQLEAKVLDLKEANCSLRAQLSGAQPMPVQSSQVILPAGWEITLPAADGSVQIINKSEKIGFILFAGHKAKASWWFQSPAVAVPDSEDGLRAIFESHYSNLNRPLQPDGDGGYHRTHEGSTADNDWNEWKRCWKAMLSTPTPPSADMPYEPMGTFEKYAMQDAYQKGGEYMQKHCNDLGLEIERLRSQIALLQPDHEALPVLITGSEDFDEDLSQLPPNTKLYTHPDGTAPVFAVLAMDEGASEPRLVSWNDMPIGQHRVYLHINSAAPTQVYDEIDYIETAPEGSGFGHRGDYKYRVWNRTKTMPSHHTNSLDDAKAWFQKCRDEWAANEAEQQS